MTSKFKICLKWPLHFMPVFSSLTHLCEQQICEEISLHSCAKILRLDYGASWLTVVSRDTYSFRTSWGTTVRRVGSYAASSDTTTSPIPCDAQQRTTTMTLSRQATAEMAALCYTSRIVWRWERLNFQRKKIRREARVASHDSRVIYCQKLDLVSTFCRRHAVYGSDFNHLDLVSSLLAMLPNSMR